jgi:hypothetical protein
MSSAHQPSGIEYQPVELHSPNHAITSSPNPFASNSPHGVAYPPTRPSPSMPIPGSTTAIPLSSSQDTLPLQTLHSGSPKYDVELAQDNHGLQHDAMHSKSRSSSWDVLSGTMKRFEHSYEEFDTRNASNAHLAYADGDVPNNKVRAIAPRAVSILN